MRKCPCPECGGQVVTSGGCWACLACGAEGCGRLEEAKHAEAQSERPIDSPRRVKIKTLQVPS